MNPRDWGAAEWEAFGTVGGLFVAIVVAIFVAVQVLQAKKLRDDQSRPYVILDFEFSDIFVNLAIRNIGGTAARNVEFTFDQELQVPRHTHDEDDFEVFRRPIPMMAPGRVIRVAFGSALDFFGEGGATVPLKYEVNAKYSDLTGKHSYDDPPIHLDLLSYKNTLVSSDHLADMAKHLKNIDRTMKSWTGQNALKVRAFDQRKQDRRTHRRLQRSRDRRLLTEQGWVTLATQKWRKWKERHAL